MNPQSTQFRHTGDSLRGPRAGMAPPRPRARWRFFGRARCDGRALGLLLMTRAGTMRAENRRRCSGRGGGGATLALVAAAWLMACTTFTALHRGNGRALR